MTFEDSTLRGYYFLRNRESLSIDPWRDSSVYFGDQSLATRILRRIESDFVQPRGVPKFYITGSYGSGKTHTLAHIQYLLKNSQLSKMHPTETIYLDIAPMSTRERYRRIHERLLDAVGLNRAREAAEKLADLMQAGDKVEGFLQSGALPFGDETLRVSQANVFRNILFGGKQMQLSWEWMKGRKTTIDEAQMLGTQKHLTEPQDFVHTLVNLGALFYKGEGQRLVFLIDEGEAARSVTNPDSLFELAHAFRMLFENANSYVGMVIAMQADSGQEDIPELFGREELLRRIDYEQGIVDLNGLVQKVNDVEQFVRQALKYLVDDSAAQQAVSSEHLATTGEIFPFDPGGLQALVEYITQNMERALPSAIISVMSNAAIEAWRRRADSLVHQLIGREIVEEIAFPA